MVTSKYDASNKGLMCSLWINLLNPFCVHSCLKSLINIKLRCTQGSDVTLGHVCDNVQVMHDQSDDHVTRDHLRSHVSAGVLDTSLMLTRNSSSKGDHDHSMFPIRSLLGKCQVI